MFGMPDPSSPVWGSIKSSGGGGPFGKKQKKPPTIEEIVAQAERNAKKTDIDRKTEEFSLMLAAILLVVFFVLVRIQLISVYEYHTVETDHPVAHTTLVPLAICVGAHIVLRKLYRTYLTIKKKRAKEQNNSVKEDGI